MKQRPAILITLITSFLFMTAQPKPDMKFIHEAERIVWGKTNPRFDPGIQLSDSIYRDMSAVFIAVDNIYDASRRLATPFGPFKGLNNEYLGETTVDFYSHCMVKLNNSKAIEEFANHTFKSKEQKKAGPGYIVYSQQQAFGARIHKKDGRTINVDISTALPETEGKKNKAQRFRISIPDLETGDVLEYFKFTRRYMLGDQTTGIEINIFSDWPTAYYNLTARFDNILTAEINTFNGLDQSSFTINHGEERSEINLQSEHLERFDEPRYCNKARQVPYIRIKTADNHSRVFGHSPSSRRPGVYINLTPPVIMAEIADHYATIKVPVDDTGKAWGLVKNYLKKNPEASWKDIADACWLASRYTALESREKYDNWRLMSLFKDVIDKARLPEAAKLAVTTSRSSIPITQIAGYDQATPILIIGDRTYLHDNNLVYRPAEIPGNYQGEPALTLTGRREELFEKLQINIDTLPGSRPRDNSEILNINVSIDRYDEDKVHFDYTSVATGARKSLGSAFLNSSDVIELTESYLSVNEKKRSKRRFDLTSINDNRRTVLEAMPEIDFSLDDAEIDSVSILSAGLLPANPTFEYRITGSANGLISKAGNDLLVNVGQLVGAANFSKNDRSKPRDISIYTSGPYILRYNLVFKIPDGYTVDKTSLEPLQVNVANLCGSYFVQSAFDESTRSIKITTIFRNNRTIYPAYMWDDFLDLRDAVIAFADATLVVTTSLDLP